MLTVTDILALWGAILSTIVLVWDIAKWHLSGPKLRLNVNTGMKSVNIPEYEGKTLIHATITNYGDRPTTLTHLVFKHYPKGQKRFRRQADKNLWVGNPSPAVPLPYELKPGQMWNGTAFQDDILTEAGADGYIVCESATVTVSVPYENASSSDSPRESIGRHRA